MIKAYLLKDLVGGYTRVDNHREQLSKYEHADTVIEEGYFLTKKELEQIQKEAFEAARETIETYSGKGGGYTYNHHTYPKYKTFEDYMKDKEEK